MFDNLVKKVDEVKDSVLGWTAENLSIPLPPCLHKQSTNENGDPITLTHIDPVGFVRTYQDETES